MLEALSRMPLLLLLALVLWLLLAVSSQLYRVRRPLPLAACHRRSRLHPPPPLAQYTIVPTDTPATYLRLQLFGPTLLQRVYRELARTLIVAGYVETTGPLWPALVGQGWLELGAACGMLWR